MDNNLRKYLPSKKFITAVLIILGLIAFFWAVKAGVSFLRKKTGATQSKALEVTVETVVQKDGNNNGIPDWEEYLWGLNPNKNGKENKEFILTKKKELGQSGIVLTPDDSAYITENEILSREFFATIVSLQQTGSLNEDSMQSVSEAIGQKIEAIPIQDIYTKEMISVNQASNETEEKYYQAFSSLVKKYENADIGSELTLLSQGIGGNDPQALYAAKTVGQAYRSFGQELIKIKTPNSVAQTHLSLANNYEKTGQSIEGLTQILTDPIVGMRAIINYKKYSDGLIFDIERLSEILQ